MAFVQIMEFRTSNIEEMRRLGDEWESTAGSASRVTRRVLCEDRDRPGLYLNIVFFDSYEAAMENSNLSVTSEFSQRMAGITDAGATFQNLDVIEDRP
jgi:hypothetical protein